MKTKFNLIIGILITASILFSCSTANDTPIDKLINHFNQSGLDGDRSTKMFEVIGAIDGAGYDGDGFSIELYEYEDANKSFKDDVIKNGHLIMMIQNVSEDKKIKIVETFQSFQLGKEIELAKEKNILKDEKPKAPSINSQFITLNSVQIGDNIQQHKNFILDKEQESFFDVYVNRERTTINKLDGNLRLYVSNSIIEKIQFDSGASFMGSTSVASTVFNGMLEERKQWVRDAMLNYSISEWDDTNTMSEYNKQNYLHQYDLNSIDVFGKQVGWNLKYIITSKNTEIKELQGKKNNLDFGSNKKINDQKDELKLENENIDFSKNNDDNTKEEIAKQKMQTSKKFVMINVDNLRVRVSPDLDADKIENLPLNTKVEFLDKKSTEKTTVNINEKDITDYWYKIKTPDGNVGWIHGCCFNYN